MLCENYSTCRCILDVLVRRGKFHTLLFHHVDFSLSYWVSYPFFNFFHFNYMSWLSLFGFILEGLSESLVSYNHNLFKHIFSSLLSLFSFWNLYYAYLILSQRFHFLHSFFTCHSVFSFDSVIFIILSDHLFSLLCNLVSYSLFLDWFFPLKLNYV